MHGAFSSDCPSGPTSVITYKCEISTTREAAQAAKAVETRKGVGRETDTTRGMETEAGSVKQTAQEIETGIVAATKKERMPKRGGPASYLIMSMSRTSRFWTTVIQESSSEAETEQTDRKTEESTAARTGAGIAGIEPIETTRETEIKTFSVAETATEIQAGTVAATETNSTC